MITLTKVGGDVEIARTGHDTYYYPRSGVSREVQFNQDNTVDITIGRITEAAIALSNLTIAGVVPTNKAQFDTQWALVFPEAGASALSTVEHDATLTGNGSIATPLGLALDSTHRLTTDAEKATWNAKQAALGYTAENAANKDATGGYAGLTLFKINFKNALNTFISFFTNANTAARTYTFQDRNGTIADDTDLAGKASLATANTFTAGAKQTLGADATNAGMRFTGVTANPSSLVEGDEWYRSDEKKFRYYDGTTARAFVTEALPQTLTFKAITKRVTTITSSATPSPSAATDDQYVITALAVAAAFASPGAGTDGQEMMIFVMSDSSAHTLSYDAIYAASPDLPLPVTTTVSKGLFMKIRYMTATSKWYLLAKLDNL